MVYNIIQNTLRIYISIYIKEYCDFILLKLIDNTIKIQFSIFIEFHNSYLIQYNAKYFIQNLKYV